MNWKDGANNDTTLYEILQKIKSHHQNAGQVFVGTDSLIHSGKCTFATTIVLLGATGQRGGLYFYKKEKYNEPTRFYTRILKEVEKSINIAMSITEMCPNINLEIHIDVSPEDGNEKTSRMAKMLLGYAKGSGFKCKVKPNAFAASSVADKHTK
ncbi:MAG: hypothetical protein GOVbin630_72 [Prokaryotic dsDNA virus sp.]|nr:MAG: hypothetical protein GOVbin630_72 [Prokaryotic dsDNA virus sp.]|tara:strand:- start:381 stop:842 length:462 start_codon:yes stop_codon:yes gene_type:complete